MSTAPQPEPVLHRAAPAWEEVRVGKADAATVLLVYAHIEEVARFDHYPPPAGHPEWGPEAIQEVASSFYAKTKPEKRFAKLKAGVNDAVSFDKKLKTAVRNHMRSEARESETGRVIRLLEHAIGNDPDVVAQDKGSAKTWSLPEHADLMPFAGSPAALVDAAYAVAGVNVSDQPAQA